MSTDPAGDQEAGGTTPDQVMLAWDKEREENEYIGGVGLTAMSWVYGLLFFAIALIVYFVAGAAASVPPVLAALGFGVAGFWSSARRRRFKAQMEELSESSALPRSEGRSGTPSN